MVKKYSFHVLTSDAEFMQYVNKARKKIKIDELGISRLETDAELLARLVDYPLPPAQRRYKPKRAE